MLPAIDFSGVSSDSGSHSWDRIRTEVGHAIREFGCFEAAYPEPAITAIDRQRVFALLKEVFALPLETKRRNTYGKPFRGYIGPHPTMSVYESLGIEEADGFVGVQRFSDALWSQGNPGFSETIHSFGMKLLEFGIIVQKMILESLGVEKYHDHVVGSMQSLIRVMHYKQPPSGPGPTTGFVPHSDMNYLTVLCQDEVNGLEVLTKEGQWVPLLPSPNSFIVLVGETFMAWSNGRISAPIHRVIMNGDKERYSLGMFMMPKAGWSVEAPDELVDEEHPLLFKPFDYHQFRDFYYLDPAKGSLPALKEYAGI